MKHKAVDLQHTFCPKMQNVNVTGIPALPYYYIYVCQPRKTSLGQVKKYPHSWSTTNLPFLSTEQFDLPGKVHTAPAVILALGSEEIPTAGRPESSAGAKDKFCLVLTQKVYKTKCPSNCPVLMWLPCDYLNICALKDAELHSFLLCTCCFFLIGFLWFYMARLEGCEDILRLSSTTSVGQGNPITIQSLEEGNFTFNGNKRRNFPSNILCSSSWMIVYLSFASSERLEDRQWCCYSISEFCLVFTAGSHWQLTFSLCSSTTPTCFSEVLLRQLFSIHKKTMACMCTRFLILSSQPGIGNSASEVQDVHLSFIKVYATDFRSSLRFKRSCWNQCVKVLVIWPHKLNSMSLAI